MGNSHHTLDTESQKMYELRRAIRWLPAEATTLSWKPDGSVLTVGHLFGNIELLSRHENRILGQIEAHAGPINGLSWSADGSKLSSASDDGTVGIWSIDTQEPAQLLNRIVVSKKCGVTEISWSPDSEYLAVASADGTVRVCELRSGTWMGKHLCNRDFGAQLSWSMNGVLAFTGRNGEIQTWRAGRTRVIEQWDLYLIGSSWSPDGARLAAGTLNGEICVWDFRKMHVEETFKIARSYVLRVLWSPTSNHLAAELKDGSILTFDLDKESVSGHLEGVSGTRSNLAWSPDGLTLTVPGDRGVVHLFNSSLDEVVASISMAAKPDIRTDWDDTGLHFTSIAWNPENLLAANLDGDRILLLDANGSIHWISGISSEPLSLLAWSPSGRFLALASEGKVFVWAIEESEVVQTFKVDDEYPTALAWSPDGTRIAVGSYSGDIFLLYVSQNDVRRYSFAETTINILSWTPDSTSLAVNVKEDAIYLWELSSDPSITELDATSSLIMTMSWSPDGRTLACGDESGVVLVYENVPQSTLRTLEGHAGPILSLAWSPDGGGLASASDDSVKLWRRESWDVVEMFSRIPAGRTVETISFHPASRHGFQAVEDILIETRVFNIQKLFETQGSATSIKYTSAKVVLVGESNVGKSCLGLRLANNQYEEQGTTHGMRTWIVSPNQIDSHFQSAASEQRDIILWDMGGQDEYRLIHQLFLHDTTLALIMFDPTRGKTSFNEVEEWSLRLEKQLEGRKATKLLVGTKMDRDSSVVDRSAIHGLIKKCRFVDFFETSAKAPRGITELGEAIVAAIDWSSLSKTTRLVLFQKIRDKIELKSALGDVVTLYSDLESEIKTEEPDYTPDAMNVVVRQLALQGLIVDTRLASGERALVLQVGEVERYAGSLIVEARNNPRGIPAIEARRIASFKSFPGIMQNERLPPFQERIVVECVVQLLIERNICLVHEGLLIFPSLFKETERERNEDTALSTSIYYDFSGAIDSIYTTLIVRLSLSDGFGRVRMWMDGAEFDRPGLGTCEIRKKSRGGGLAHLDLSFSQEVPVERRNLFILFVEDHLSKEGVTIIEGLSLTCQGCGEVSFEEWILRTRLAEGKGEITCQRCETVNRIIEGAQTHRENNPDLVRQLIALKTDASINTGRVVAEMKNTFDKDIQRPRVKSDEDSNPIRILHLSDMHLIAADDAFRMLQPLVRDLEDKKDGFGLDYLDYLVISGDLTNRGTGEEYDRAYEFISELRRRFQLTPHRCIIVPGNHDQDWETRNIYRWKRKRDVNLADLRKGTYVPLGQDYVVRDEKNYNKRFQAFSKFYHSLIQQEYPLNPEDQCLAFFFADTKIQFIGLNSAWEIDEFFSERSSVNDSALSKGLLKADEDLKLAVESRELLPTDQILRIAVWHHPATGTDSIKDNYYLERLQTAGVHLCLTGHIHEERADILYHLDSTRNIHVVGAGSVGAVAKDRPPSTPRLYNLLEISRDHSMIRVNTRARRKDDGKWSGWNVWPSPNKGEGRSYYDLNIKG